MSSKRPLDAEFDASALMQMQDLGLGRRIEITHTPQESERKFLWKAGDELKLRRPALPPGTDAMRRAGTNAWNTFHLADPDLDTDARRMEIGLCSGQTHRLNAMARNEAVAVETSRGPPAPRAKETKVPSPARTNTAQFDYNASKTRGGHRRYGPNPQPTAHALKGAARPQAHVATKWKANVHHPKTVNSNNAKTMGKAEVKKSSGKENESVVRRQIPNRPPSKKLSENPSKFMFEAKAGLGLGQSKWAPTGLGTPLKHKDDDRTTSLAIPTISASTKDLVSNLEGSAVKATQLPIPRHDYHELSVSISPKKAQKTRDSEILEHANTNGISSSIEDLIDLDFMDFKSNWNPSPIPSIAKKEIEGNEDLLISLSESPVKSKGLLSHHMGLSESAFMRYDSGIEELNNQSQSPNQESNVSEVVERLYQLPLGSKPSLGGFSRRDQTRLAQMRAQENEFDNWSMDKNLPEILPTASTLSSDPPFDLFGISPVLESFPALLTSNSLPSTSAEGFPPHFRPMASTSTDKGNVMLKDVDILQDITPHSNTIEMKPGLSLSLAASRHAQRVAKVAGTENQPVRSKPHQVAAKGSSSIALRRAPNQADKQTDANTKLPISFLVPSVKPLPNRLKSKSQSEELDSDQEDPFVRNLRKRAKAGKDLASASSQPSGLGLSRWAPNALIEEKI